MAHATLTCWLRTSRLKTTLSKTTLSASTDEQPINTAASSQLTPRHLIFTSSLAAFFSLAGYAPYTPGKLALRGLADTLSQEMNLYAAAHPNEPPVRIHTIFPSSILGEAFDQENKIKSDVTRMLETSVVESTSETIAYKSIKGLESGEELIMTNFSGSLLKQTMTGATRRGIWTVFRDSILASISTVVVHAVRVDMDRKVRQFGRKFGPSGMKTECP